MIESLDEMKGYIFNSSSLLLIYDEKYNDKCDFEEVQVKLIDFANVQFSELKNNEPDENLVKALKSIESYLKTLIDNKNMAINLYF